MVILNLLLEDLFFISSNNINTTMKICQQCNQEKHLDQFEIYFTRGKPYTRKTCKVCKNRADYAKIKASEKYNIKKKRNAEQRQNPKHRVRYIISDSKLADKKCGFVTQLSVDFVKQLISKGCFYCNLELDNDKNIKIGLDRINNNLGHIETNVNASCSRCNFIRKTMPYDAWMVIVPSIKLIVENGMLDNWQYGFKHHMLQQ